MHFGSRTVASIVVGVTTLLVAGSPARAQVKQAGHAALPSNLATVRNALSKYEDPLVAIRDGYLSSVGCVDFPKGGGGMGQMAYKPGGMGVHFINMGLVGPKLDSLKPQILIYEPVGNKLKLVAAEWFMPLELSKTAPTVLGMKLDGPMEGHQPIMPAALKHWDLHVWLWKDNPNGAMHSTNSTITCPDAPYTFHEEATKMAHP